MIRALFVATFCCGCLAHKEAPAALSDKVIEPGYVFVASKCIKALEETRNNYDGLCQQSEVLLFRFLNEKNDFKSKSFRDESATLFQQKSDKLRNDKNLLMWHAALHMFGGTHKEISPYAQHKGYNMTGSSLLLSYLENPISFAEIHLSSLDKRQEDSIIAHTKKLAIHCFSALDSCASRSYEIVRAQDVAHYFYHQASSLPSLSMEWQIRETEVVVFPYEGDTSAIASRETLLDNPCYVGN